MGEPATKKPKLLADPSESVWNRWNENLRLLQDKLLGGCLCNVDTIELQRPPLRTLLMTNSGCRPPVPAHDYTIQFICTINLLSDTALAQHAKGFICPRVLDMANGVSADEAIWELLLESLNSLDRFISHATSKCLVSFLMWTKLPLSNLQQIFNDLFNSISSDSVVSSGLKLSHALDVIRGIVEYKDEDDHPLEIPDERVQSSSSAGARCAKVEVDTEIESEVKNMCIKSLESCWTGLLSKFHKLLSNYEDKNEAAILTFLSLWQSVISVKANLSVVETKNFHMQLGSFVPHLNSTLPPVLWKKILDVYSEILCYGSTLSLQDCLADEPCDLAHLIIRCVKNRQFLQGVPYSKNFTGFGGSTVGPVDWEWESEQQLCPQPASRSCSSGSNSTTASNISNRLYSSYGSSNSNHSFRTQYSNFVSPSNQPCSSKSVTHSFSAAAFPGPSASVIKIVEAKGSSSSSNSGSRNQSNSPEAPIRNTIYIGPTPSPIQLDESYEDGRGDRSLLQKLVLVVLKSVAVTVKETRAESDSEDSGASDSESDTNDMMIIERSIREVFQQVDAFIKSLLPFHPATPLGEWMVKLFSDQDDALVEAMLCGLDTYTGFHGLVQTPPYLQATLNPVVTFISFASTVSEDRDVLLDLLMSNETSFLLYFLRFLKFSWKNWPEFVSYCGRDLEKIMGLLIRLRIAIGRLVEKSLFPYNINPVLRLLERIEEVYEAKHATKAN